MNGLRKGLELVKSQQLQLPSSEACCLRPSVHASGDCALEVLGVDVSGVVEESKAAEVSASSPAKFAVCMHVRDQRCRAHMTSAESS